MGTAAGRLAAVSYASVGAAGTADPIWGSAEEAGGQLGVAGGTSGPQEGPAGTAALSGEPGSAGTAALLLADLAGTGTAAAPWVGTAAAP